jgi:hypothetical protein
MLYDVLGAFIDVERYRVMNFIQNHFSIYIRGEFFIINLMVLFKPKTGDNINLLRSNH